MSADPFLRHAAKHRTRALRPRSGLQSAPELSLKGGDRLLAQFIFRTEHVEGVHVRGVDVDLGRDARRPQVFGVIQRLPIKRLAVAHKSVARRKA